VFICDEVQTGFGRTGGRMFGIEHWGVQPDIMTMAKGVANGMPLGVTIATPEIADAFKSMTISTFGGNPMSCAAANATLEVMESENLPANAETQGRRLRNGLEELQRRFPDVIGDVRGMGLMQALELVEDPASKKPDPARARARLEATRDEGLLIGVGGLHGHIVRLGPSLLVTDDEIDDGLERMGRACDRVGA